MVAKCGARQYPNAIAYAALSTGSRIFAWTFLAIATASSPQASSFSLPANRRRRPSSSCRASSFPPPVAALDRSAVFEFVMVALGHRQGRPSCLDDTAACIEFFSFVQEFCREMHENGVIDRPFNPLGNVHECAMVFDMTSGLMGQFVRLVRRALKRALLEGKTALDWETLCLSYSTWRKLDKSLGRYDPCVRALSQIPFWPFEEWWGHPGNDRYR